MDQIVFNSMYQVQQIILPTLFTNNTDLFLQQVSKNLVLDIVNQQFKNNGSMFRLAPEDIGFKRDRIMLKKVNGHVTRIAITWPRFTKDGDDSDAALATEEVFYKNGDFTRVYTKERTVDISDMMKAWEPDPHALAQYKNDGWMLCGIRIHGQNHDHVNYGRRNADADFVSESGEIFRGEFLAPHKRKPNVVLSSDTGAELEDPV